MPEPYPRHPTPFCWCSTPIYRYRTPTERRAYAPPVDETGAPTTDIAGARAAHQSLVRTARSLRIADLRRRSLLADWTMGHVLTHIARNADGHCNMFAGAARGEVFAQYPGGMAQRVDEIEQGAQRPASEIVDDLEAATARLEACWDAAAD